MTTGVVDEYLSLGPMVPGGSRELRQGLLEGLSRIMGLLLLVLLSPVLVAVTVAVLVCDGGPIFFGHYRVGRNGKLFRCWKFRTMARDADARLERLLQTSDAARSEWAQQRKLSADPRVTRLGSFLRRSSLDELPQLLNVVCGQMAFVGPRPITYDELHLYGRERWYYLSVTPGITGLWQVSGRNELTYDERIQMDRQYVESRTWLSDLRILVRTVFVVLGHRGVY